MKERAARLASGNRTSGQPPEPGPTVIIVGPPWPRSAAIRVIQNQVQFYRERGFRTAFVGVPFYWYVKHVPQSSKGLTEAINELDADKIFTAIFDQKTFDSAKYKASNRHALLGTVLDWQVVIARAARLSDEDTDSLGDLRGTLFHVNHLYTLGFALDLRKRLFGANSKLPLILETHDVQSHLTHEKRDRNPGTGRPDSLRRLIRSETTLVEKADVLVHLSLDDMKFFQTCLPSKPQFLAFPTIDEKFRSIVRTASMPAEAIDLLFVGQWHPANLGALKWFFEEIWPLIARRHYKVRIVGQIGQLMQRSLPQLYDDFRSFFVGEVVDLVPYYRAARCVIAPMLSGTGISIKTIEALAMGKPLVGTSKAFRGMPIERLKEAGIQAFNDPQSFAQAISRSLSAEHDAAAASRAAYDDVFSARASFASRDEALRAATVLDQAVTRSMRCYRDPQANPSFESDRMSRGSSTQRRA